jgi:predicted dehydrogenase
MKRIAVASFEHLHAYSYLDCLINHQGAEVAGVYDDDRGRVAEVLEKYDLSYYEDYGELLETEKPDGAIVTSANVKHRGMVERSAAAGVSVLCEKPIATTMEDAEAMIEACKNAGVTLGTAFPCRYAPTIIGLKSMIESGGLGDIAAISSTNHGQMPPGWFSDPELAGGGAVFDHTVHLADAMRWFLASEVVEVYAEADTLLHDANIDDVGLLSIKFANGIIATIDASWSRPEAFPTWGDVVLRVIGSKSTIEIDCFKQHNVHYRNAEKLPAWQYWGTDINMGLISDWLSSLEEGREPSITGHDGLKAMEVALMAYESIRTNQPVSAV